jgi:hypothetical protein
MKKPPAFLSTGNEVEVTMKKGKTPHPQAGRGLQFMVGYQSVGKGARDAPLFTGPGSRRQKSPGGGRDGTVGRASSRTGPVSRNGPTNGRSSPVKLKSAKGDRDSSYSKSINPVLLYFKI